MKVNRHRSSLTNLDGITRTTWRIIVFGLILFQWRTAHKSRPSDWFALTVVAILLSGCFTIEQRQKPALAVPVPAPSVSKTMVAGKSLTDKSVSLAWDRTKGEVLGYKIYYGTNSRSYKWSLPITKESTNVVAGLNRSNNWFFAVTVVDTNLLESDFSNEASVTNKTRVRIITMVSTNAVSGPFYNINETTYPINFSNAFFKLVIE